MADNNIIKVAVDAYHGNVEKYSVGQSQQLLREALVEANGGSTILDYRRVRDGKCGEMFSIIEEILSHTVVEGLQENDFFNALVDFRNVAEGDQNLFLVEDSNMFVVADVADGTQGIRRQRLGGMKETSVPTIMRMVKIYEELNRVLAGRVDFNHMIDKVGESFQSKLLNDVYNLWAAASGDDFGDKFFPMAGSYSADALLDVIAHVEASANGRPATIIGTKKAVRKISADLTGAEVNSDMYNNGFVGKFYGTNVIAIPQRHAVGTTDFMMPDDSLTIIAGDAKPIKCVYEGEPLMIMGNPLENGDLTQEYLYGEKYGMGIVLAGGNAGIGRYSFT